MSATHPDPKHDPVQRTEGHRYFLLQAGRGRLRCGGRVGPRGGFPRRRCRRRGAVAGAARVGVSGPLCAWLGATGGAKLRLLGWPPAGLPPGCTCAEDALGGSVATVVQAPPLAEVCTSKPVRSSSGGENQCTSRSVPPDPPAGPPPDPLMGSTARRSTRGPRRVWRRPQRSCSL